MLQKKKKKQTRKLVSKKTLRHCFKLSLIPLKSVEPILKSALEFLKAELHAQWSAATHILTF